jgi:hypothetical protein
MFNQKELNFIKVNKYVEKLCKLFWRSAIPITKNVGIGI